MAQVSGNNTFLHCWHLGYRHSLWNIFVVESVYSGLASLFYRICSKFCIQLLFDQHIYIQGESYSQKRYRFCYKSSCQLLLAYSFFVSFYMDGRERKLCTDLGIFDRDSHKFPFSQVCV